MVPRSPLLMALANQKEIWPALRLLSDTGCRNHPVSLECLVASKYSVADLFGPSLDSGMLGIFNSKGDMPFTLVQENLLHTRNLLVKDL